MAFILFQMIMFFITNNHGLYKKIPALLKMTMVIIYNKNGLHRI